jgi:polyisoprenoid-binding protein YceI
MRLTVLCLVAFLLLSSASRAQAPAEVPVFEVTPPAGGFKTTFNVKASVPIEGVFEKWEATLKFTSPDVTTGVLDIRVDADSVNTGSGLKDGKLKGKDFFDAKDNPYITLHSSKIEPTGPTTFDIPGTFTIRGVSKPETLSLTLSGKGTGTGSIKGSMAFDRKEYGMNSGIPFIKIAERVEVDVPCKQNNLADLAWFISSKRRNRCLDTRFTLYRAFAIFATGACSRSAVFLQWPAFPPQLR